jgi:tRNA threonylcarbamoyl adenosine modification protein YeaZ
MNPALDEGLMLAVDTSTHLSIVAAARGPAGGGSDPATTSRRDVKHRHGSHLLEQIDEVLAEVGASLDEVTALAVGTGPGSFTGLRVGMATVKTIAYARELPLVGVMSAAALRRASGLDTAAVVLPAGAHDHYLSLPGADPVLVSPGGLAEALGGAPVVAVDIDAEVLGQEAAGRGAAAVAGLPAELLVLARERLAAGEVDDAAELTPAYVALPRGVKRAAEDLGWSPDLR